LKLSGGEIGKVAIMISTDYDPTSDTMYN